jgi:DNA ligase-1
MYKDGKSLISKTQRERRKILEKTISQKPLKIVLTKKLISGNEKEIEKFYKESLNKGNEGIMIKNLNALYKPGRRVGGWVKHKPIKETLDLVITEAEWGEGKRAKWLSSFTLACRDKNKLLTIGKVGTGIAEKNSELTFESLTKELKPLIKEQKGKHVILKPELILEIGYEEIQKSPTYTSKFALRFPKVLRIRTELGFKDIDDINRVKRIYKSQYKTK